MPNVHPSEMFGTPIGVMAYEDQANQNALASIKAAEELGKIAMMPAERAQKEAHAKLYAAQAGKAEAEATDLVQMQQLGADLAKSTGRVLTAEDALKQLSGVASRAEPWERAVDIAISKGMNPIVVEKLADRASNIRLHEAHSGLYQAQEQERKEVTIKDRAQRASSFASSILDNPTGDARDQQTRYSEALQAALIDPDPVIRSTAARLPTVWNAQTAGMVNQIRQLGMTAAEQSMERIRQARLKADEPVRSADEALRKARAAKSSMDYQLGAFKLDALKKLGGGASAEVVAQQESNIAKNYQRLKDAQLVEAPKIPADLKIKERGVYTMADGAMARAYKKPDGNWGFTQIKEPPKWWDWQPRPASKIKEERANLRNTVRAMGGKDMEDEELPALSTAED